MTTYSLTTRRLSRTWSC